MNRAVGIVGLRRGLRVPGHGEGLLRGVVVPRAARRVAGLVDPPRRLLDRSGKALPVLGERLQDLEPLPHLVDREERALREGSTRELERGRPRVPRPVRAELVEDEGDDADQAVVGTRRFDRFGRLRRRAAAGLVPGSAGRGAFSPSACTRRNDCTRARFAVLEHLHLVRPQVLHEPAGLVADDEVEQDEVGSRGKDRSRRRFLRPPLRRSRQDEQERRARRGQLHRVEPSLRPVYLMLQGSVKHAPCHEVRAVDRSLRGSDLESERPNETHRPFGKPQPRLPEATLLVLARRHPSLPATSPSAAVHRSICPRRPAW